MTQSVTKPHRGPRKCEWCKEWFTPSQRGRPAKFCSAGCRQRAYERLREERRRLDPTRAAVNTYLPEVHDRSEIERRVTRYLDVIGIDAEVDPDKLEQRRASATT